MNTESIFNYMNILNVSEDIDAIYVKGETFSYGFSKKTGLISSLQIMGNDFLKGTNSEIPDIYVSDDESPQKSRYSARFETEAKCEILSANLHEVHIRAHGLYRNLDGFTFPIRYRITYEIASDGTIFIIVDNKATDSCIPRWLCISAGTLNSSLCKYYSHLAEQNDLETTENYVYKEIEIQNSVLFDGKFIPWFWFGNDKMGIDVTSWDVGHQRYGTTIITGKMNDQYPEIDLHVSASTQANGVSWEILSIKDNTIKVNSGWEHTSYFALSVNPCKPHNTEFSNLLALHIHPEQHNYPSDEQIQSIALKGANLIISSINQPGIYTPDNENELRRVISTCHNYGIKIIPHLSLMELNKLEIFPANSTEWQVEPSLKSEGSTVLMCPGSDGWRKYWKEKIDNIIDEYDFDGLYLDLRYDRLVCRNPLHGCQRKHIRPTFLWVREMLIHAWLKVKSKSQDSVIMAKTGVLPVSMIDNWLDVRCIKNADNIIDSETLIQIT
jgi:hypothetical protein